MHEPPDTLADVVRGGLCAGCGICASLSDGRIEMRLSERGHLRPAGVAAIEPSLNAALVDICPGATVIGPDPAALEQGSRLDAVWGPLRSIRKGWSSEPSVRHRAAAGGVLTALARFLLDTGRSDAVLHVRASTSRPMLSAACVSRTAAEALAGAQSRYGPAAPLVHVQELLDAGERFAVIAKPCDITAIRNLARHDARVERQVTALLTNFCGGVPSVRMAESFAAGHGIGPDEASLFRFRGEGWPGSTRVEADDGRSAEMTYRQAYLDRETRLRYDAQWRCKVCPDAIGEVADVSVPDAWILDANGRPAHDEAPGVNVVLERTVRGSNLVRDAAQAGYLELAELSPEEFESMHHDHRSRRLGEPARLAALRDAAAAAPRVAGYRLDEMEQLASSALLSAQYAGARERIERGQSTEALPPPIGP